MLSLLKPKAMPSKWQHRGVRYDLHEGGMKNGLFSQALVPKPYIPRRDKFASQIRNIFDDQNFRVRTPKAAEHGR